MDNGYGIRNPRTGQVDYWIMPPTPEQLGIQCSRLREAQIDWHLGGLTQRIEALQQWKEALFSHKDELIEALVTDTGRFFVSVQEVDSLIFSIDRWCELAEELLLPEKEKTTAIPFIHMQNEWVPYSLVGVISPWNFPLLLSTTDTIPALLAGCAVVVKPSEIAPRFIQPLVETIDSVPALREVLAYFEGTAETGATLIDCVDLICFTGSVETGQQVAEEAARRFIPAFLELGGKDPAIVLESAGLDLATSAILWGSVFNSGQSCVSIERIYVAESVCDRFVEQLVEKAQQLHFAYPTVEDGEIGPIIAEKQAAIITEHIQDAVQNGAVVCCGGGIQELDGGLWCRPTILTHVNHSMKVMTEETFGPIMPIMSFSTVEEVVQLANDSIYGLSAAVFAESETEALKIAQRLEAGAISLNDAALTAVVHEAEKNAFKFSGMGGSRMGLAALKRFMRKKVFLIQTESVPNPWWF